MLKNIIFLQFPFHCLLYFFCQAQTISSFIHVDQFGYLANSEKVAVISNPQSGFNANETYQVGTTLELRNLQNDNVVFTNTTSIWDNGNTHSQSGDAGWWFDFSSFNQEGTYYIYDPSTQHRSASFEINSNPYSNVLRAATKMFYYNRCNASKEATYAGTNWTDSDNFMQDNGVRFCYDQNNPATARDLRGGWFDAGDYNKYVTFAHDPIHQLLTSFENNPAIFTDDWNIPESNNGVPDILDEIKWELDWLYKMINADGTVILKVGSLDYNINDAAPPSNNTDPRYYTPTCSSASLAIASTHAHAAKVYAQIPTMNTFAQLLESDAILCWNRFLDFYDNDNLEIDCDDLTVKAGDADWDEQTQIDYAVVAAIYLFDLTGNQTYSDFVATNLSLVEPIINSSFGVEHAVVLEALLNYTTLTNANTQAVQQILTAVNTALSNNWNNYFGFSEDDLYRAYAPDWVYFWGSNMAMANIGNLCNTIAKYNVSSSNNTDLLRKAAEQLHYFHGINPQGLVYLSNMYAYGADRSINEIAHTWFIEGTDWDNALTSLYGPAPGFLTGGPNQGYSGTLSPPANQPIQKAYLDYNDWFTDPAYEITEPAIYYQAAYIQLISNYVNTDVVSSSINVGLDATCIEVFPNPSNGIFTISGTIQDYTIEVLDINGATISTINSTSNEVRIDLSLLDAGTYFVRVSHSSFPNLYVEKILKM